ncbi:MAG: DUF1007 family protein [Hyphomicrobiaceae bacterium]|nr:DUF1007 family protein [Hyphomicrobiaceae bacterium]
MKTKIEVAATALAVCAMSSAASAHPHVWVSTKTEVVHDAQGRITGFQHRWTFDEVFSTYAAQGMDKNGDGKFDRAELAELAKVNITSLSEFDFFTFAKVGEKQVPLNVPEEGYYLSHENGQLTLHFTLPLKTPLDARKEQLRFAIYDPTYFVAFSHAKDAAVTLASNAPRGCEAAIEKPKPQSVQETKLSDLGEAFFNELGAGSDFGAQFASDVLISCKTS